MADHVFSPPSLTSLAWEACTADCRRIGVRGRPCTDCRWVAHRMIVRLTAAGVVSFPIAREILNPPVENHNPETSA